jgi:hypothetical protein
LRLDLFNEAEREQYGRNTDALRARLAQIPRELEQEISGIHARYADPQSRLFPVAVVFLVPEQLYEAALTVMMRLVFLLFAEEQNLLLLGDDIYDQHYAVSTLMETLREAADRVGEEVLERRFDAWARLVAIFRVVYGGGLFNPERFPFLEGRPAAGIGYRVSGIEKRRLVRKPSTPGTRNPKSASSPRCRSATVWCCTCLKRSRCCGSSCATVSQPKLVA